MRQRSRFLAAALVLGMLSLSSPSWADLVISIDSLSLAPNNTGTLDVNIASNSPSGNDLDAFGFELRITTTSPRFLEFASTQPDPYSDSSYVFSGNSFTDPFPLGFVMGPNNNTYIGGDSTFPGTSVHIGATNELLIPLSVVPGPGTLAPMSGDTFTISLVSDANTFFLDGGANVPFTTNSGTVTILSAVPEPASIVMLGSAGLIGAASWLVTRRRAARPAPDRR